MTDHDAIAARVRLMSDVCECDTDYCRHAEAHDDAPDYDGISAAYLDLYDEVQRLRAERDRLRAALESIAKNTCCEGCQEAALVARQALKGLTND